MTRNPRQAPKRSLLAALGLPCLLPLFYRLLTEGIYTYQGMLSDLASGLLMLSLLLTVRFRLLTGILLLCWFILQIGTIELREAVGRLPVIQDLTYLTDPVFLSSSAAGFHLSAPVYTALLAGSILPALFQPVKHFYWKVIATTAGTATAALLLHSAIGSYNRSTAVNAQYNAAHWLVADVVHHHEPEQLSTPVSTALLKTLNWDNDRGVRLLPPQTPRNILLVTIEGIPGIALAGMRDAKNISGEYEDLSAFDSALQATMLVPDFTVHSHQTIRGLYAIHCGDFSKFSFDMPKAYELLIKPNRGNICLPAQLAANGWSTHYLQGAPLEFMNKDKVMPVMGFQEVHGVEWFTNKTVNDFIWGTVDADFFAGAKQYINELRQQSTPWFLSLLTVGTHQPFYAREDLIRQYGSRKKASMAELDLSVTDFIGWLRQEGVLDNTLVIFTSDESHGSSLADWTSSWGYAAISSPSPAVLPQHKTGEYGLIDIEASVLDYFGLPVPAATKGRSLFRDYDDDRNMFSYTAGRLRWHNPGSGVLECSSLENCLFYADTKMIGKRPEPSVQPEKEPQTMYAAASILDHSVIPHGDRVLDFSNRESRSLPEQIRNEWTDNLVGAQYLDFPAGSHVQVDIDLEASGENDTEIALRLVLRQFEKEVKEIAVPDFPLLHNGEKASVSFQFDNPEKRQAFTFHLVGEGKNAKLLLKTFQVTITEGS